MSISPHMSAPVTPIRPDDPRGICRSAARPLRASPMRALAVLMLCATARMTGCSSWPSTSDSAADPMSERIVATGGTTVAVPPVSPGVVGNQSGLEIQWWVVDDPESFVGAALAKYADGRGEDASTPRMEDASGISEDRVPARSGELDDATRSLWWSNGLRILTVPIDDLGRIKSRLDVGAIGHTQWLGLLPTWTQVLAGPDFEGRRAINLDSGEGGRVVLDGGKLRLLTRCWTAPSGDGTPTIRIELVPQHVEPNAAKLRELAALESRAWTIEDEGLIFTRLRAGWSANGNVAYLIVPESPTTDWTKVSERAERSAAAREREQNIAEATRVGPFAGAIPSVGEAMLTSALSDPEGKIGKRIVIVIVPRMPEQYELITK